MSGTSRSSGPGLARDGGGSRASLLLQNSASGDPEVSSGGCEAPHEAPHRRRAGGEEDDGGIHVLLSDFEPASSRTAAIAAAKATGLTIRQWRAHPVTSLPPAVIMHIDSRLGMTSDTRMFGSMGGSGRIPRPHIGRSASGLDLEIGRAPAPKRPPVMSRQDSQLTDPIGLTSADTTIWAWGWLVVAGAFVNQLWCWGSFYALTVLFPTIRRDMGSTLAGLTWAMSIAAAVMFAWQLVVGWAAARFGPRVMAVAGSFIYSTGMVCISSCRSLWEVYVALGFVTGTGMALLGGSVQARVVGQYFDKRVGLALGIMVCGVSLGATILPYIYTAMMQAWGWRSTLRAAAGAALVTNLAGAAAFRPRQLAKRPLVRLKQGVTTLLPVLLGLPLVMFGYWVVFIFIAPYAVHAGLNATQVATLVAVMSMTNGMGRIGWGWVSDCLGALPVFTMNVVAKGVLVAAMPLVPTHGDNGSVFVPLLFYVALIGVAAGGLFGMLPKILMRRFGVADFPSAYGLSTLCASIGSLTGAPVAAMLVEEHSWFEGLLVSGIVMVVGVILMASLLVYVGRQHFPANLSREVSHNLLSKHNLSRRSLARVASARSVNSRASGAAPMDPSRHGSPAAVPKAKATAGLLSEWSSGSASYGATALQ